MAKIVYLLIATLSTGMANPEQTKAREWRRLLEHRRQIRYKKILAVPA